MNKKMQVASWLFIAMLLVNILFSYEFIISNAHHDCSGEDCPVCVQIEEAVQFISNIKFISILPFVMTVLYVLKEFCSRLTPVIVTRPTLVSEKIKLLN